jgi:hypothetical protein
MLQRPDAHNFEYWKNVLASDPAVRGLANTLAQLDPGTGTDEKNQAATLTEQLLGGLIRTNTETRNAADDDQLATHILQDMAGFAQVLRFQPLVLVLLDDEAGAEREVKKRLAKRTSPSTTDSLTTRSTAQKSQSIDDSLGVALYYITQGTYDAAIRELTPLASQAREERSVEAFQVEYLLAMCYRRGGDHNAEARALSDAVKDLEALRRSLRTRNLALSLRSVRQMIYEEYLGTLFSTQRNAELGEAIGRYKRSTQMPIAVLREATVGDAALRQTILQTTFLYDVLSQEDVWRVKDSGVPAWVSNLVDLKAPQQADPKATTLASLNHIADVLVDQVWTSREDRALEETLVIPPDGLTLAYFAGARGLYRFTSDSAGMGKVRYVPIAEAELSALCAQFRAAIEEHKNPSEAAGRLYDLLLADLPEMETRETLYFSPDGALQFIPFQALRKSTGSDYLVQTHVVSYLDRNHGGPTDSCFRGRKTPGSAGGEPGRHAERGRG